MQSTCKYMQVYGGGKSGIRFSCTNIQVDSDSTRVNEARAKKSHDMPSRRHHFLARQRSVARVYSAYFDSDVKQAGKKEKGRPAPSRKPQIDPSRECREPDFVKTYPVAAKINAFWSGWATPLVVIQAGRFGVAMGDAR